MGLLERWGFLFMCLLSLLLLLGIFTMNAQTAVTTLRGCLKTDAYSRVSGIIVFVSLSVVEQKTLHVSWLMAQVYYHVLSTPILNSKGEVSKEANEALSASTKSLKQIKKDTYTMVAEEAQVGDIIWKPEANKILVVNFFAVGILIALGCLSMSTSVLKGILFILCGAVAFPIFFKFRSLPASRLYTWRLVRLIGAIVIAIAIAALL